MILTLERKVFSPMGTGGNLLIDGKWFAHVVEDRVRAEPGQWHKSLKVYGETAIPYGRYPVMVTWSERFKRQLTGIFNVPDFDGIRIHNGTSAKSSAGCPIISIKKIDDFNLINDKTAMNTLCDLVLNKQQLEKIWIDIIKG